MRKQTGLHFSNIPKPVFRTSSVVLQLFVFPRRPYAEFMVDVSQRRVHGLFVKASIVVNPSLNVRSKHVGKIKK
jgi:hypothetical protein